MKGAVTPVKNREQCDLCWAFRPQVPSKVTGTLSPLSKQQLLNCDTVDSGRNGELLNNGFASDKKSTMCTETVFTVTPQQGHLRNFRLNPGSPMKVSRDT